MNVGSSVPWLGATNWTERGKGRASQHGLLVYFPAAVIKYSGKSNLMEKGFIFSSQFKSVMVGKIKASRSGSNWPYGIQSQEKERDGRRLATASWLTLPSPGCPAREWPGPQLRSVIAIKIAPHSLLGLSNRLTL